MCILNLFQTGFYPLRDKLQSVNLIPEIVSFSQELDSLNSLVCDTLSPRAGNIHVIDLFCQLPQKHLVRAHSVGPFPQALGGFSFPLSQQFLRLLLVVCCIT